jgi:hypothetical protein
MRPFTQETITDRRQPVLRWSAVFAGATVAVALWVLLQMLAMGAGLAAIDLDDAGSLRSVGIGTTVMTLLVPLIALFVGGFVAGRLATTYSDRVGAMHGFVAWGIAALVGTFATIAFVGMLASGSMRGHRHMAMSDDVTVHPGMRRAELQDAADNAGKMLLGASLSMLASLGAAVGGGALATHNKKSGRGRHNTQQVPVVPPPAEAPLDAPHPTV